MTTATEIQPPIHAAIPDGEVIVARLHRAATRNALDIHAPLMADAADYLTALEAENAALKAEVARLRTDTRATADDALKALDALLVDLEFKPDSPLRMKIKRVLEG